MIIIFIVIGSFNTPKALSWEESLKLENHSSRTYVFSMNESEEFFVNVSGVYFGEYHLFIFKDRPKMDYIQANGQYSKAIFNDSIAYNLTSYGPLSYNANISNTYGNETNCYKNSTTLNFTAPWRGLFYIEVILYDGGPDMYLLDSNVEMTPYFIPFLPGYPTMILIFVASLTSVMVVVKIKKKTK